MTNRDKRALKNMINEIVLITCIWAGFLAVVGIVVVIAFDINYVNNVAPYLGLN